MPKTIHTILKVKNDPGHIDGTKQVEFIIHDSLTQRKRRTVLGHLSDDDSLAKAQILARIEELWDAPSAREWDDAPGNIQGPKKKFLDNLPDLQQALTGIDNATNLKPILKKMVKAIYALKEAQDG